MSGFKISSSEVARRYGGVEAIPSDTLDYNGDKATIVAGFSLDDDSEPADYLLQAAITAQAAEEFEEPGIETDLKYVIADHQSDVPESAVDRRYNTLEKFVNLYLERDAEVVLQSELAGDEYSRIMNQTQELAEENPEFAEVLRSSVPPEKREEKGSHPARIANSHSSKYAIGEAATIALLGADYKVGPPDEIYFDRLVRDKKFREIADIEDQAALRSLIASPTLPAGKSFSHGNVEVLPENGSDSYDALRESRGVPPYKNTHNRVELGDDSDVIEAELEGSPLEQQIDMSLLAEFMEQRNPSGEERLPDQLAAHFQNFDAGSSDSGSQDGGEGPTATTIHGYGGDIYE